MTDSQSQRIIPLSQDALQEKFASECWKDRLASCVCQSDEKQITFDNWRTTATIKRKKFTNSVTGVRATIREITKDGQREAIILVLGDRDTTWVYNGIPATV